MIEPSDRGAEGAPSVKVPLDGTMVDFVIGLQNSGFTFENPQAKSK